MALRVVFCWKTGSAVTVPLYKGKGERTECSNYRGISLLSVVGKIYAGILVDRVHKTEGLINDEQGGFRAGRWCRLDLHPKEKRCRKKKKCRVYMGFMDLEKVYDRVNREAQWQVLRMYDVDGKLFSVIKIMYVNSLVCFKIKGGKIECFRINSGVRQGFIMSPWLFNVYIDTVMKVKLGKREEWKLHGLLSVDDLVLCDELQEELRMMVGHLVEVCRRRGLKVNAGTR